MKTVCWLPGVLAASLLGQGQPAPPFRAGINAVEVDVVVRNRAGAVRGLTQQDFEVFEDGVRMSVEAFSAVHLPEPPAAIASLPADRSLAGSATNDYPEDGRLLLIVLDDFHIRFDGRRVFNTRHIARRLVERLAPGDLAAIVSTSSRQQLSVEFTGD